MTKRLRDVIECAFSASAFEEALITAIADSIDYEEVAEIYLDKYGNMVNQMINDIAADVAEALF